MVIINRVISTVIGTEIPPTCAKCIFPYYEPDIKIVLPNGRKEIGGYLCFLTHSIVEGKRRNDDCPLIEVPEGKLFGIKDGVLYVSETEVSPNAKVYKIPDGITRSD